MKFSRFDGADKCRVCGKSLGTWESLKLIGYQVMPPFEDDPGEVLELRNHDCGGTFAELLPFTAQALEDEISVNFGGRRDKQSQAEAIERLKRRR